MKIAAAMAGLIMLYGRNGGCSASDPGPQARALVLASERLSWWHGNPLRRRAWERSRSSHGSLARPARAGKPVTSVAVIQAFEYNRFFEINGGHSRVTLDLPWGRARLDDADTRRYLHEIRPAEADQGLPSSRDNLQRMTRTDLVDAVAGANVDVRTITPCSQRDLVVQLTTDVVRDIHRTYPRATADELLVTFITVLARGS